MNVVAKINVKDFNTNHEGKNLRTIFSEKMKISKQFFFVFYYERKKKVTIQEKMKEISIIYLFVVTLNLDEFKLRIK